MKSLILQQRNKVLIATKALLLVATVWGIVYPSLLWSLGKLLP